MRLMLLSECLPEFAAVGQVEGQGVSVSWPWVRFHSWYYIIPITVKLSQHVVSPEGLNVMVCRISKTCILTVQYEPTGWTIYFQFISIINLFVFRAGLLLIIRRYYSVCTAVGMCHAENNEIV